MLIAVNSKPVLLIVTGNRSLALEVAEELYSMRYQVELAEHFSQALEMIARVRPQFILLDWRLPVPGAAHLCRAIRDSAASATIPVIAVCTNSHASDRIAALQAGVNDYLAKPFAWEDLAASLLALQQQPEKPVLDRKLIAGDINLAMDRWMVYVSGQEVELSHKEIRLLEELVIARGHVLTRETLLQKIWGYTNVDKLHTRTVDIHISRLRHKLGLSGNKIITVRKVGYRMDIAPSWISRLDVARTLN